jgi:hypothetical protein
VGMYGGVRGGDYYDLDLEIGKCRAGQVGHCAGCIVGKWESATGQCMYKTACFTAACN